MAYYPFKVARCRGLAPTRGSEIKSEIVNLTEKHSYTKLFVVFVEKNKYFDN